MSVRPVSSASRSRLGGTSHKSLQAPGALALEHGDILSAEAEHQAAAAQCFSPVATPSGSTAAARLQQQKSIAAQKRLERLQLGGIAHTNEGLVRSRPGSAGTPSARGAAPPRLAWEAPPGTAGQSGDGLAAGASAAGSSPGGLLRPYPPPSTPGALLSPAFASRGAGTTSADEIQHFERIAPAGLDSQQGSGSWGSGGGASSSGGGGDAERQLLAHGLSAVYDPTGGKLQAAGSGVRLVEGSKRSSSGGGRVQPVRVVVSDVAAFLMQPGPREGPVQCIIMREKDTLVGVKNHKYQMFLDDGTRRFLIAARRRKGTAASHYDITTSAGAGAAARYAPGFVGKLRANFVGTEFLLFDNGAKTGPAAAGATPWATAAAGGAAGGGAAAAAGSSTAAPRKELTAISYEPNILGTKGPRKMVVAVPVPEGGSSMAMAHARASSAPPPPAGPAAAASLGLMERLKAATAAHEANGGSGSGVANGGPNPHAASGLAVLRNKSPRWNESMRAFCLNFGGRVLVASVKNFQLAADGDPDTVVLQFGKVAEDEFTCDFRYPLTALQAFGIALSSFDSKLACE